MSLLKSRSVEGNGDSSREVVGSFTDVGHFAEELSQDLVDLVLKECKKR